MAGYSCLTCHIPSMPEQIVCTMDCCRSGCFLLPGLQQSQYARVWVLQCYTKPKLVIGHTVCDRHSPVYLLLQVTLNCLHQMFDSAKDIMQWLSLCAQIVAKANKPVHWTTPLGLPVVQPYRKQVCPFLPLTNAYCWQPSCSPPSSPASLTFLHLGPLLRSPLPVDFSCVQVKSYKAYDSSCCCCVLGCWLWVMTAALAG